MSILEGIVRILNSNPIIFLVIFILSLIANLIQIYTFIQDRQQIKTEIAEKAKLAKLVDTYEYILNLAKHNIKTEGQLAILEAEITQKANVIGEMDSRLKALQQVAQKKLVSQALERNLSILLQIYQDITKLRAEYAALGELPDIPESTRHEIEQQVNVAIKRPYEFPRSFIFKSTLLVLFIFFLPWPVDSLLVIVFLPLFLETFFEAAIIYRETKFTKWTLKNANWIGLLSAFGAWQSMLNAIRTFLFEPVNVVLESYSQQLYGPGIDDNSAWIRLMRTAMNTRWSIVDTIVIIVSIVFAILHWKAIRPSILSKLREKLIDDSPSESAAELPNNSI